MKEEICKNCHAELKSKYLIRVGGDPTGKPSFYQSRTKRSIVGWIKHIVDNYQFEEIEVMNLLVMCQTHEKYWKNKEVKA